MDMYGDLSFIYEYMAALKFAVKGKEVMYRIRFCTRRVQISEYEFPKKRGEEVVLKRPCGADDAADPPNDC
jgi:hypothetical protein